MATASTAGAEPTSSSPHDFVSLPGAAVFLAHATEHPDQWPGDASLWRTDGTPEATFELRLCSSACNPRPQVVATSGYQVFVTAFDETQQLHLWRTDGTREGTVRLTSFQRPSRRPHPQEVLWVEDPGRLFFVAEEWTGWSLWASDGTAAGTERVFAFPAAVGRTPYGLVEHAGAVYFFVVPMGPDLWTTELWRSGGTAASTAAVALIEGEVYRWNTGPATSLPGRLLFVASERGSGDEKLWATDGTAAGTVPLAAFPGSLDVRPKMTRIGDRAWFWGTDAAGRELWTSDGTEAGTRRLSSTSGTNWLNGAWDPQPWQGGILFSAEDPAHGLEVWASDGTPEGTALLLDLCPGPCSTTPVVTATEADRFYFVDDEHAWESDGTPAGTRRLTDVRVSIPGNVPALQFVDDDVFFRGVEEGQIHEQLWAVEQATGAVRQLTAFDAAAPRPAGAWQVGVAGDRLVFAADDGSSGFEPWVSDGTVAGTRLIADISPDGDGLALCYVSDWWLFLERDRFRFEVAWTDHRNGGSGIGRPIRSFQSDLAGYFWFFDPENVELIVKVLDGTSINGFHWTFYGALTDVEYEITVTDTFTGERRTYHNPPGEICGAGDIRSLPGTSTGGGAPAARAPAAPPRSLSLPAAAGGEIAGGVSAAQPSEPCVHDAATLCLLNGRFRVRVAWLDQHNGGAGSGGAVPFSDLSGFFWFFTPDNVELVVKALDARALDGHFWFFYGALSDVGYTITVEDLVDGHRVREYVNPPGEICGAGDTSAFSG